MAMHGRGWEIGIADDADIEGLVMMIYVKFIYIVLML